MGIDRIGKGSVPPSVGTPSSAPSSGATGATRAFEVKRPTEASNVGGAGGAGAVHAVQASPLEQLRAGQVDVNGYVDLKVNEATAHLEGLGPAQLDTIRKVLRAQMASDPALADLVRQATGSVPSPSND